MRKSYVKPTVFCEELCAEQLLCACDIQNPNLNEEWQCGYEPEGLGMRLFAETWTDCYAKVSDAAESYICYHVGTVNLFGS